MACGHRCPAQQQRQNEQLWDRRNSNKHQEVVAVEMKRPIQQFASRERSQYRGHSDFLELLPQRPLRSRCCLRRGRARRLQSRHHQLQVEAFLPHPLIVVDKSQGDCR